MFGTREEILLGILSICAVGPVAIIVMGIISRLALDWEETSGQRRASASANIE